MKEIKEIIVAFEEAHNEGKETALITLVHVEGSSYRRPGARMLITEDGLMTGAISGGCLEGDALRKALLAISEKRVKLVTYDTNDEDDAQMGLGLGCNGIIQVLIEPIDVSRKDHPLELLKRSAQDRRSSILVTAFSLENKRGHQIGTCLLYNDQEVLGALSDSVLQASILEDATNAFDKKESSIKTYISDGQDVTAFLEYLQPPISLVVAGAGNDAHPLIEMAKIMGWDVTVVDGRPEYANKNRFVSSCSIVVAKPEKALASISIDSRTVFVLMTHNYNYDIALLRQLINHNTNYIGVLGPKKKLNKMLDQMRDEGVNITEEQRRKIFGPVGLDIGAETPEEIALSIVAEIKAAFSNSEGKSLRERDSYIHSRSLEKIEHKHL